MLIPTIIMGVVALALFVVAYQKGGNAHVQGLKSAGLLMLELLPLLFFAFAIAGMAQILVSGEVLSKWIGVESGIKGIFIGTFAGCLCPGGPFVVLPLSAGLLKAGANVGIVVAFISSWALLSLNRLPMEVGILGWKFTMIRMASVFFFPPIAGLIAQMLVVVKK